MEKVKITVNADVFFDEGCTYELEVTDILRGWISSQFTSLEDLIGYKIENVEYDEGDSAILTLEKA